MKSIICCFILCTVCFACEAIETNAVFVTDQGGIFIQLEKERYINPEKIEEAKTMRESLPAKDFPEGNWGEQAEGVQVSVRLDKQSYSNKEPINTVVLVRNITNHPFLFYPSNKVIHGEIDFQVYTGSNQTVTSKAPLREIYMEIHPIVVFPGTQRKYTHCLNDTYDLTNGNFQVQASIAVDRMTSSNTVESVDVKSAKVPIEIK